MGSTGYSRKEPIGQCFAEKNDAKGLVALHKYYHDGLSAHLYTTDKNDVDLDQCEYEGIMCYVYPPDQTEQEQSSVASALFSSFIEATTDQPIPSPTAAPTPAPTAAPSSAPKTAWISQQFVPPKENFKDRIKKIKEQFPGDDMFISST